jgi:AGZA family xanthine/uracil permease-like MFS transporter
MWDKLFHIRQNNTSVKTEIIAGSTTFMTMAYIIFVQPAVLSACGMDYGSVFVATCISSAIATILLGIFANYPIAQAPAMGHNFFFAFAAVPIITLSLKNTPDIQAWEIALGANFISGLLFLILSFTPLVREIIVAIPPSLKNAIATGIGLLIALIGLQWGGLVVDAPNTLFVLGNIKSPPVLLTLFGTLLITTLMALRFRGAILVGLLVTAIFGLPVGAVKYSGLVASPPSIEPTFIKLRILDALSIGGISIIFTFFILDIFDTIGTLIGVSEKAGFLKKDGSLPRSKQAIQVDAFSTSLGTLLGTSTITCYVESAAGIAEGGKTGLANIITGLLFLLSLFFSPMVSMIGKMYPYQMLLADGRIINLELYPVIAPALIVVGCLMMSSVQKIQWGDFTEAIPAFLTILMMPFSGFSITEGIAFGFISYTLLNLATGQIKKVHWLIRVFAILFIIRYIYG